MELPYVSWGIVLQLMRIHGESKQVLDIRKNNGTHVNLSLIKSSLLHFQDQLCIFLAP